MTHLTGEFMTDEQKTTLLACALRFEAEGNKPMAEDIRALLARQPAAIGKQEADDDIEEAREILENMVRSIELDGNYSTEATCTFLRQALNCLPVAAPLATEASKPAPSVEQDARGAFLDWWCADVPENLREGWKERVDQCLRDGNATDRVQKAWEGFQFGVKLARAASTSANVAQGAEELGWAWERRYLNGGYSRKFCVSEFDARELAKDGENLPAHDLVYPFYTAPPAQTALTDAQWLELRRIARTYNETGFPKHAREFFAALTAAQSASGDTK